MRWGLVLSFFELAIVVLAGCGVGAAIAALEIRFLSLP